MSPPISDADLIVPNSPPSQEDTNNGIREKRSIVSNISIREATKNEFQKETSSKVFKDSKEEIPDELPSSEEPAPPALQKWNESNVNVFRTWVTFLGMFNMGLNDAAYGVSPLLVTIRP